jgi:hypothetical protein
MSKLIYFFVPLVIILGGIVLISLWRSPDANDMKYLSEHLRVISTDPPRNLAFSDEKVPLERDPVRARLDKELQHFIYYHSSSMLLMKRAGRYRESFKRILRENDIPEDFFYLSIAESGLANVTSPKGARGFWQFMPSTAIQFGLEVSETVDERYHPEKATRAACRFFQEAYDTFHNWTLVAASYNMGINGVLNALKRNQSDDYYALQINRETSRYLFRILSHKILLENPAYFGFNLKAGQIYKPIGYSPVYVTEDIQDLAYFASTHGTTLPLLKMMNPWLISGWLKVREGKTYEIRIPYATSLLADELIVNGGNLEFSLETESDSLETEENENLSQTDSLLVAEEAPDSFPASKPKPKQNLQTQQNN